jgi:hypothetical protein
MIKHLYDILVARKALRTLSLFLDRNPSLGTSTAEYKKIVETMDILRKYS